MNTQLVINLGTGSGNETVSREHVDAAVNLGVPIENPSDPISTQAYIVAYVHYLVCQREKLGLSLLVEHIKPTVAEMWQEVLSYLEDRRRRVVDVQSGSLVFTLFCPTHEASDQLRDDIWREELQDRLCALIRFLGTYVTRKKDIKMAQGMLFKQTADVLKKAMKPFNGGFFFHFHTISQKMGKQ